MNDIILPNLYGMKVVANLLLVDTLSVQARKHRTKRINKKYLKKYGYKQINVPSKKFYLMGHNIILHPSMIPKINAIIK